MAGLNWVHKGEFLFLTWRKVFQLINLLIADCAFMYILNSINVKENMLAWIFRIDNIKLIDLVQVMLTVEPFQSPKWVILIEECKLLTGIL
jgi:hypothetical protein